MGNGSEDVGELAMKAQAQIVAAKIAMPTVLSSAEGNANRAQASTNDHVNESRACSLREGAMWKRGERQLSPEELKPGMQVLLGFASPYWIAVGQPCM